MNDRSVAFTSATDPSQRIAFAEKAEAAAVGDEFRPAKPWLSTVVSTEPSMPPPIDPRCVCVCVCVCVCAHSRSRLRANSPPDAAVTLEWVHGCRLQRSRSTVRYTRTGDILFPAAALGVWQSRSVREQRFFNRHTDEVLCIDVFVSKVCVCVCVCVRARVCVCVCVRVCSRVAVDRRARWSPRGKRGRTRASTCGMASLWSRSA